MKNQSINFFGLDVTLTTKNALFSSLFENKFGSFTKDTTEQLTTGSVGISFGQELSDDTYSWEKIDSQIQINNEKNAVQISHFYLGQVLTSRLLFNSVTNRHTIEIAEQPSLTFFVLNLLSRGMLKRQLYQNVIKLYIEQPLYHYLCENKGLYCLHASGVSKDGKGTLFYGLNGVGKSTLSQYVIKNHGFEPSSDNYILISKREMFASPESVRLASDSATQLDVETNSSFGFGKKNISSKMNDETKSTLSKIVFVSRGSNYSFKSITRKEFEQLLRLQEINGEDVQSSVLAHLVQFSKQTPFEVTTCTYYHLTIHSYDDLEKVADELHT